MVDEPAVTATSAGPITGSVVPVAATVADTVPAGSSRACSSGFDRFDTTAFPPARTSTAGAAATCRTTRRPWPAATAEVSLVNTVAVGDPSVASWATAV